MIFPKTAAHFSGSCFSRLTFRSLGPWSSGEHTSAPDPVVLPPAELHSGGADVHAARPRLARADRGAGFVELHLALLLPHHRSVRRADRAGDAESRGAGRRLAVRRRVAVLAARGLAVRVPVPGGDPAGTLSQGMILMAFVVGMVDFC